MKKKKSRLLAPDFREIYWELDGALRTSEYNGTITPESLTRYFIPQSLQFLARFQKGCEHYSLDTISQYLHDLAVSHGIEITLKKILEALHQQIDIAQGIEPSDGEAPPPGQEEEPERLLLSLEDLSHRPPIEWIIPQYLYQQCMAVLYAPSGSYKTYLALEIALSVHTGKRVSILPDLPVAKGGGLFICLEGEEFIRNRMWAWKNHNEMDITHFRVMTKNLFRHSGGPEKAWEEIRKEYYQEMQCHPSLVVIDTRKEAFIGSEINDLDMMRNILAIKEYRVATRAMVLIITHPAKGSTNDIRGSDVLRASSDMILGIKKPTNSSHYQLFVDKAKDCEKVKKSVAFKPRFIQVPQVATKTDPEPYACVLVLPDDDEVMDVFPDGEWYEFSTVYRNLQHTFKGKDRERSCRDQLKKRKEQGKLEHSTKGNKSLWRKVTDEKKGK